MLDTHPAGKIMLAPNPKRQMKIDRVIVVGKDESGSLQVLSVDMLGKSPLLMKPFGARYSWATALYHYLGVGISILSLIASFAWKWWLFVPGFVFGSIVFSATRQSTADFAIEILRDNPSAFGYFASKGVIWRAPFSSVVAR